MKTLSKISTVAVLALPFLAVAQQPDIDWTGDGGLGRGRISDILMDVSTWVGYLVAIVLALGLLTFLWGVVKYITAGADEEKRVAARNLMLYGVIGLFVMVAIWGLVYLLGSFIGVKPGGATDTPAIPCIPGSDNCDDGAVGS